MLSQHELVEKFKLFPYLIPKFFQVINQSIMIYSVLITMILIAVWLPLAKLSSDETSNLTLLNYKVSFIPLFESEPNSRRKL